MANQEYGSCMHYSSYQLDSLFYLRNSYSWWTEIADAVYDCWQVQLQEALKVFTASSICLIYTINTAIETLMLTLAHNERLLEMTRTANAEHIRSVQTFFTLLEFFLLLLCFVTYLIFCSFANFFLSVFLCLLSTIQYSLESSTKLLMLPRN